jgi:hypothetical protein
MTTDLAQCHLVPSRFCNSLLREHEHGGSRAAKLYNQLGDLIKAQDAKRAAELYGEAAQLYASEGWVRYNIPCYCCWWRGQCWDHHN